MGLVLVSIRYIAVLGLQPFACQKVPGFTWDVSIRYIAVLGLQPSGGRR